MDGDTLRLCLLASPQPRHFRTRAGSTNEQLITVELFGSTEDLVRGHEEVNIIYIYMCWEFQLHEQL
jgi:hypothetical protein